MIERTTDRISWLTCAVIAVLFIVGGSTCRWLDSQPKRHLELGEPLLTAAIAAEASTKPDLQKSPNRPEHQMMEHWPPVDEAHDERDALLTSSEGVCIALVVLAEAGGESLEGKVAVADLVVNRLQKRQFAAPDALPCDIVHERDQFVAAGAGGLPRPRGEDPAWHASLFAAESVLHDRNGLGPPMLHDDPTKGATCMLSPANMPKDRAHWPAWAKNPTATIGGHQFFICKQ